MSIREYCEKMSTGQLRELLRRHCEGTSDIPVATILLICDILAERDTNKVNAEEAFRRLCKYYLDE